MTNKTNSRAISSAYRQLCAKVIITTEKDLQRLYKKRERAASCNEQPLIHEIQLIESFKKSALYNAMLVFAAGIQPETSSGTQIHFT